MAFDLMFQYLILVFPFCKNPEEHPVFSVCFTKQWQDTLMVSFHNFLATIFQCMQQPTLSRVEPETVFIRRLQDENSLLRSKLQVVAQQQQHTSHQSRLTTFTDAKQKTINDVVPFDIPPPAHIVDDFYIIAQETINLGNSAENQARGLKSLIKNIGGNSPVMGRKDNGNDRNKRSGSAGSKARMYN